MNWRDNYLITMAQECVIRQQVLHAEMNTQRKTWEAFFLKYEELLKDVPITVFVVELGVDKKLVDSWWADLDDGVVILRYNIITEEGGMPGNPIYAEPKDIPSYEYLLSVPGLVATILSWAEKEQKQLRSRQKAVSTLQQVLKALTKKEPKG